MSAAELALVTALALKAQLVGSKGHYARSCEKLGEAVVAAQALSEGDCLITAFLQAEHALTLLNHASAPAVLLEDNIAAVERAAALLRATIALLQRRKAAACRLAHCWQVLFARSKNPGTPCGGERF